MGAKKEKTLTVLAGDMHDALLCMKDAMSKDPMRPHLNCVHVEAVSKRKTAKGEDGKLYVVGTNGHVLNLWTQDLADAPNLSFNIKASCVKRMIRELADVRREYKVAQAEWDKKYRYKKEPEEPEPKEPTITFRFGTKGNEIVGEVDEGPTYTHAIGTLRLDLTEEKYPPWRNIAKFHPRKETPPPDPTGVSAEYVRQAMKCIQVAVGDKNVGIKIEFHQERGSAEWDLPMMRFTAGYPASRNLQCFVMPMKVG